MAPRSKNKVPKKSQVPKGPPEPERVGISQEQCRTLTELHAAAEAAKANLNLAFQMALAGHGRAGDVGRIVGVDTDTSELLLRPARAEA